MTNPFLQRNLPLSELLQMQQRYGNAEGENPANWFRRAQLRNTNEAIDQFKPAPQQMRPQPQPMRPQPQPMGPRPAPRPMAPRPMGPQPAPMPMPAPINYTPGVMGAAPGGTAGQVTVSGGGGGMTPDWAALGMGGRFGLGIGGGMPGVGVPGGGMPGGGMQRGTPYGGYFGGFSAQQPYRPAMGGFAQRTF